MAHSEQQGFVGQTKCRYPDYFRGTSVLEVGSRNINGSVRAFFDNPSRYIGIDCTAGPGVDVVCLAHEYPVPEAGRHFDVLISCEAFEHDPYLYDLTIPHIVKLLRPGGLFVATCASVLRQEHGTIRSNNPEGTFGPDPNFYAGVCVGRLTMALAPYFNDLAVELARFELDVYASGIRNDNYSSFVP